MALHVLSSQRAALLRNGTELSAQGMSTHGAKTRKRLSHEVMPARSPEAMRQTPPRITVWQRVERRREGKEVEPMLSNLDKARSCKLGTMPALVIVHASDAKKIKPDTWIRVREHDGEPWKQVFVRSVWPDGYFQADR